MKAGFGNKKAKKKKANKRKAKGDKGADADMQEAPSDDGVDCVEMPADAAGGESAKEKQKSKMELKKSLKVRVAGLKQARAKLTKVPGNKIQRKEVSEAKKAALSELQELGKGGKGAKATGGTSAQAEGKDAGGAKKAKRRPKKKKGKKAGGGASAAAGGPGQAEAMES